MVHEWCHDGLRWFHKGVTIVYERRYDGLEMMSQEC
jgi:hypothetical protein